MKETSKFCYNPQPLALPGRTDAWDAAALGSFVTIEGYRFLQGRKMCVEDKRAKKRSRNFLPGLLGIGLRLMQEGDEMVDSAEVLYIYNELE